MLLVQVQVLVPVVVECWVSPALPFPWGPMDTPWSFREPLSANGLLRPTALLSSKFAGPLAQSVLEPQQSGLLVVLPLTPLPPNDPGFEKSASLLVTCISSMMVVAPLDLLLALFFASLFSINKSTPFFIDV